MKENTNQGSHNVYQFKGHPQETLENVFFHTNIEEKTSTTLPKYSSVIDQGYHVPKGSGTSDNFRWHIEEQRTDDDIHFDVGYFEPSIRKTNIAMFIDTSWTTQVKGLNSHTASIAARLGIPTIVKGPEYNVSIPLSHSAHNTHALIDAVANNNFCEADVVLHKGYSRGAMIGFGVNAYASTFNRTVLYSERDDPCLAHNIFKVSGEEVVDYINYVPQEVIHSLKQIGKIILDPRRLRYYHKTIDISTHGLAQIVRTGLPLFGGEAGVLAENIPSDVQMNVLFLKGMPANHRHDFKRRLAGREGIVIQEIDGTHTDAIARKHVGDFVIRLSGLAAQLQDGATPNEIDFLKVHLHDATHETL